MTLKFSQKIGIIGICMFTFSLAYQYVILPPIIQSQVKKKVALKQGWFMRGIWGKFPFSMDLNFYFFNITNPDGIENGEKPKLQEVGPFSYLQYQEKSNQIDHEDDDTVSFTFKNTYQFNPSKSNGLTGDEVITVPNYLALGLVNVILRDKPNAMPIIGKAMDSIFKKPTSIFMTLKVKDLLFNGFEIDCKVKDFAGSAVCLEISQNYEDMNLIKTEPDKYIFSLWGSKNGTDARARTRVDRGIKKLMQLGTVVEHNNQTNVSIWNDDYCDKFQGTDGTIFHPFFNKDGKDDIIVFNTNLCRSLSCHFVSKSKYSGLKSLRYTTDLGTDGNNNPQHKCYCSDPNDCLKKGVYDAYKCLKVPLVVSNPHFYLADPSYASALEGIKPDKEKHEIIIDIEPFTGVPLHARTRAQMNIFIMKLEKVKLMKNFPEALLPLFWFEEVMILPDFLVKELKSGIRLRNMGIMFNNFLRYGGITLMVYAGFISYNVLVEEKKLKTQIKMLNHADLKDAKKISSKSPSLHPAGSTKPVTQNTS